jgi:hypothetical protein
MQFMFNKLFVVRMLPISLLALSACGNGGVTATATTAAQTLPPNLADRPQVISGWLDEYSDAIESNVSENYPALLAIDSARMGTVCPNWDTLSGNDRQAFWSSLIWSISDPESSRTRTAIYRETTLPIDSVTGQQIRSEGLLQVSYVDVVNYAYPGNDISWAFDKAMALKDYANGVGLGNPNRTILNAYANLNLGLWIMNKELNALNPSQSLENALGHYWSSMRSTGSTFSKVLANLKTALPVCFK